jgi:hypothetical protein
MLTTKEVRERVKSLAKRAAAREDAEELHATEDALYADVLSAIAKGKCEDPGACARAALKTRDIQFERYCA